VTINARYASHFALEVRSRAIKPIVIADLANSVGRRSELKEGGLLGRKNRVCYHLYFPHHHSLQFMNW
jgi:hypothetical protein